MKLIQIWDKETISEFITRITRLVNQVKACGETTTEQYVVEKILISLTLRFYNVVVVIEEFKYLSTTSKEELQSTFKAHEQRMKESNVDKAKAEIALQTHFVGKDKEVNGKWSINKGRGNYHNNGVRDS